MSLVKRYLVIKFTNTRKHSQRPKAANYLRKTAPPQMFGWALNTPPEREIV